MLDTQPSAIHYFCYVDKTDRNWQKHFNEYKREMQRTHNCTFTVQEFDASEIIWTERRGRLYAADEYVQKMSNDVFFIHEKRVDAVKFFVSDNHWQQGRYRLKGFKLGRVFSTYYATFTRWKFAKDTGEHEALHFVDEYVLYNIGVRLETVFGVQDFDNDIVHSQEFWKDRDYNYDEVWDRIRLLLGRAVYERRMGTFANQIHQARLRVQQLLARAGITEYKSNSIYEVEIEEMHTTKCFDRPLFEENAVICHIDLGTEKGTIEEILNGPRTASYHWYIPRSADRVIEFVPKNKTAWHAGVVSNPEAGLGAILGGNNEVIESGEPNLYAYGICYEGRTTSTKPTDAQVDLAHQLLRRKGLHELPLLAHYQVTDHKPRIVSEFVTALKNKL